METNYTVALELQITQKNIYLTKKFLKSSQDAYTLNKSMRRICLDSWLDTILDDEAGSQEHLFIGYRCLIYEMLGNEISSSNTSLKLLPHHPSVVFSCHETSGICTIRKHEN